MSNEQTAPPEGFEEITASIGFTDVLKPFYRSVRDGEVSMGMWVQPHHTNLIGICHGGVLMTLADVGASWALNSLRERISGAPTMNLSFDFISAAKAGDWLETHSDRVELKKRFGFSSGVVVNGDGKLICRYSGTFYFPEHDHYDKNFEVLNQVNGIGASD